jgi:hypothetical protein
VEIQVVEVVLREVVLKVHHLIHVIKVGLRAEIEDHRVIQEKEETGQALQEILPVTVEVMAPVKGNLPTTIKIDTYIRITNLRRLLCQTMKQIL